MKILYSVRERERGLYYKVVLIGVYAKIEALRFSGGIITTNWVF